MDARADVEVEERKASWKTYPKSDLRGLCAIVTGASSGIGEACAMRLSEEGARLVLVARRMDRLNSLKEEILSRGGCSEVHLVELDVTDVDKIERFLDDLPERFREVDILINNAGLALGIASVDVNDMEQARIMMETNVMAPIAFTRAIVPGMIQRQRGHIVNMGSVAGHESYAQGSVYCASKFALDAFTTATRHDLMDTPIRVTVISPGAVNTEFSTVRYGGDKKRADAFYEGFDPLLAEDIADNVLYALTRPPHVQICDILVYATRQSGAKNIARHV